MWFTAMGNQPLCSLLQAALSAFQPIASFIFRGPQRRGELLQLTRELGRARDRDHGRHADAKTTGRFSHGEWSRSRRSSPRRLLLGERRPVLKKPGCRCDTSRALLQRDDARIAACHQRRAEVVCARLLLLPPRLLLVQLGTQRGTQITSKWLFCSGRACISRKA